jgi:hypothetical protein
MAYDPRGIDVTRKLKDDGIDVLSHSKRKDRVHIFSLDVTLTHDVCDRIHDDPRTREYELIFPASSDINGRLKEIENLAVGTVSSRMLIMDVRSYSLPRLQSVYNKIIGYNRKNLNSLCHTLLIGDGPTDLFYPNKQPEIFAPLLARWRIDYYAAAFFYDPFIHLMPDETRNYAIDNVEMLNDILNKIPRRLAGEFDDKTVSIEEIRKYFRAANTPADKKDQAKRRRIEKLKIIIQKRIDKEYPDHAQKDAWLSRQGVGFEGEQLKLHIYPFFFEDWVYELMQRARKAF